ncbi:hypothetical protein [Pacificoceanicola onchidii]|uniref:hypothetical protein n=1 Tax=Pacificoceanicola onchidii TaxID=2562685 RepID=UPI0010A3DBA8|nr:hypothetical protein [Pacificoceanicola onchidii]
MFVQVQRHLRAILGVMSGLVLAMHGQFAHAQGKELSVDDSFISNELCVGSDCDGSEPYGADTLTLKDGALKLLFHDTSLAVLPDRNWSIETGLTSLEEFVIRDVTAGVLPFQIAGDAPNAALFVADDGDIGLGTTIPAADMHIVEDTSSGVALRLQTATGNSAFDRTFELDLSSTWVSLENVLNTTRPFRVHVNAPENAFQIRSSGNVGMGLSGASDALHIQRTDGTAGITVENTSGAGQAVREMFRMVNHGGSYFTLVNTATSNEWYFVHENNPQGRFMINHSDGGLQMGLTRDGDMTLLGELFTAGSCSAGCDRVFDEDYPLPTIAEQAAMMREMRHLPNVGPTPEDGPFNITRMTGGMLNELEKAHLFIVELSEENAALKARDAELAAKNADLEARLAALEALLLKQ